jgi:hypothetical protein
MHSSPAERQALDDAAALEEPLVLLEQRLQALGLALHAQDARAVELGAAELHAALARAMERFGRAARDGGVPAPLRQRLALCGGQVAAQRDALARATASLDRAMDVLLPPAGGAPLYGAGGATDRGGVSHGNLRA